MGPFFMKHSKVRGAYCLGIFQNGKDPTTLLGGNLFAFILHVKSFTISNIVLYG